MSGTRRRRAAALVTAATLALLLAAALLDAERRRARRDDAQADALVALLGVGDLALSSSARWLRHPSQAEPAAASADLPSSLDVDPAGALMGPPRAVLRAGAAAGPVTRGREVGEDARARGY